MYNNRPDWYGPGGDQRYPNNPPPAPAPNNMGQRLARYTPQPTNQMPSLAGRMIQNPNEITPDEVPMNGALSVFPQEDLSCIYAKAWTENGITTVRYIPEQRIVEAAQRPNVVVIPDDFKQEIFGRLEAIETALSKPKRAPKTKEENQDG